jgi:hypothetical protein
MKELWSKQYLDHISFITYPFGLFLGSFESPRVSAGIPVTIPTPATCTPATCALMPPASPATCTPAICTPCHQIHLLLCMPAICFPYLCTPPLRQQLRRANTSLEAQPLASCYRAQSLSPSRRRCRSHSPYHDHEPPADHPDRQSRVVL